MSALQDAVEAAEKLGHVMVYDPAHPVSTVNRHTCRCCGRAVLCKDGNVYGSALTAACVVPAEVAS